MPNATQVDSDFKGENLSITMFGAVGDGILGAGSILAGSHNFVATSGSFSSTDIGKIISIGGAGTAGTFPLTTTISLFSDATHVSLTAAAATAVTASPSVWGTDNTSAIQAALTYLSARGANGINSVLRIPHQEGVFLSRSIIAGSNLIIEGGGQIDLIDDGTTTGVSLSILNAANVQVRDFTLSSTNAVSRTGLLGNLRIEGSQNIKIVNINVIGSSSTGIFTRQSYDILYEGVTVSETWADGIHTTRGCKRVRCVNCHVAHTGDDGISFIGIVTDDGITNYGPIEDVTVQGCHVYNVTKSVGRGITFYGVHRGSIIGNSVDTTYDAGILLGGITGLVNGVSTYFNYDVSESANQVYNPGTSLTGAEVGIFVSYARNVTVNGNTIDNSPGDGITVFAVAKDIIVSNNAVSRITGRGIIQNQVSTSDSRVIQQLFTDYGDTGLTTVGISFTSVDGNIVRDTGSHGIDCEGEISFHSFHQSVSNNKIYQCSGAGVNMEQTDYPQASHNTIPSPIGPGITFAACSNPMAKGNTVLSSASYGIGFIGCTNGVASDANYVTGCTSGGIFSDITSTDTFITGNVTFSNLIFQVLIDNTGSVSFHGGAKFNNFGDDYISAPQPFYQAAVNFDSGINLQSTPNYAQTGGPAAGLGNTGSTYQQTDTGDFWAKLVTVGWTVLSNLWHAVVGGIRTDSNVGIGCNPTHPLDVVGDIETTTSAILLGLSPSIPVKTDGSKKLSSGKIDLTSSNDIVLGGITSGDFLTSGGSVVSSLAPGVSTTIKGVNVVSTTSITYVTSVNFAAQTFTTSTSTLVVGVTTDSHSTSSGLVTS